MCRGAGRYASCTRPDMPRALHFVMAAAAFAAAGACGGKTDDGTDHVQTAPISGGQQGGPTRPGKLASADDDDPPPSTSPSSICPDKPPSSEAWCPAPRARCTYADRCSLKPATEGDTSIYECQYSRWTRLGGEYTVACPSSEPANASACDVACRYSGPCQYTTPCGKRTATCEPRSGTWYVTGPACDAGAGDGAAP